jgi:flagellar biosynthetic protein FliQ
MSADQVVQLTRQTLEMALWLGAPLLIIAAVISLLINVAQVLTSLQDATISTIPRLAAVGIATLCLMPWMVRRLALFTVQLFSDFRPYLQ